MTITEARARLEAIRQLADDPEEAHIAEDAFCCDVLQAIAAGCADPIDLAQIALQTSEIEFSRWYA